jgi:outer membrane receptor for ferrienterochelin and colicins
LRQAEVIKGAATALYGPAAFGGVVNLVSRSPADEHDLLLNQTTRSGTDAVGWLGKRISDRWGYTVVGGVHHQDKVDVDRDGWADLPGFERDRRGTLFSEAALMLPRGRATWLIGAGYDQDRYHAADVPGFDYTFATPSVFAQSTLSLTQRIALSASGRCDRHSRYSTICSPRLSVLVPVTTSLTARLSVATGFFAPTPLTEETEVIGLSRLRPPAGLEPERVRYGSLDVTEKLGALEVNGTLFLSRIQDPVMLRDSSSVLELVNATGPTRTGGVEVFATYLGDPFTITADYAYLRSTQVSAETGSRVTTPLDPRLSVGLDVAWDNDETGTRVGIEAFYTGSQAVEHDPYRTTSRPYTTIGILVSQRLGPVVLHLNGENLANVRQTRYDPLRPARAVGGRRTSGRRWRAGS